MIGGGDIVRGQRTGGGDDFSPDIVATA